jgi:SAM-dependent methyltransferase
MDEFSAEWLALREPADHAARSSRLARAVAGRLSDRHPVRIVDLAAGSGSNLRYLARYLPQHQHWRLVDHDAALLARVDKTFQRSVVSVHLLRRDLARLDAIADVFDKVSLVTASALLDLVSGAWLDALAEQCARARAAALFALSYDGRIACTPADRDDETVRELVNRHQRTEKGFGRALGPDAIDAAERCFARRGFALQRERSDWTLDARAAELQRQLIEGWAAAAADVAPESAALIDAWRQRRLERVAAGRSTIVVGHEDVAAWIR